MYLRVKIYLLSNRTGRTILNKIFLLTFRSLPYSGRKIAGNYSAFVFRFALEVQRLIFFSKCFICLRIERHHRISTWEFLVFNLMVFN